jgi:hypothetical protein
VFHLVGIVEEDVVNEALVDGCFSRASVQIWGQGGGDRIGNRLGGVQSIEHLPLYMTADQSGHMQNSSRTLK